MFAYTEPKNANPKTLINKAQRKIPEYKFLHQIADNMAGFVQADIVSGIKTFKDKRDFTDMLEALERGNRKGVFDSIPFGEFKEIEGIRSLYEDTVAQASKRIKLTLPKVLQPKIRFDITNDRIVGLIDRNTAALVTNLKKQTEKAVRDAIKQTVKISFAEGLPPRKSAKLIKDVIGLNRPQERAVFNFRQGLVDAGFSGNALEQKVSKFAEQKLKERAILIARTETINAVNAGQQEVWNQAFEQDLIDENTDKIWIVTPDDRLCPICANPKVDGQRVNFKDDFTIWLPVGGVLSNEVKVPHPTAHPDCRCGMRLAFN